jgi:ankyrin repeat protein
MKRSLSTAELPVLRPLVPDTSDDPAPAVEPAADEPAPVQSAEPNAADHGPMPFPGPYTYVPRPAVMQDSITEPGSASSASSGRDGSGEAAMLSTSPGANCDQTHGEPAPTAGGSTTAAASAGIMHPVVDDDNPDGYPPLILAASKGWLTELKALLQDSALDINQRDKKYGMTALMAASCDNKPEVVACLLAAGAKVNLVAGEARRTALMMAALNGHVAVVEKLAAHMDIVLDQTDADGWIALHVAADKNKPDVVAWLLAAGAKVNLAAGEYRCTALMVAALSGHVEVVEKLVAHKDIVLDQTDADGWSALHWAANQNKPDVVAFLLAAGASITHVDAKGDTALIFAIVIKHAAVVEVLMQYGADLPGFQHVDLAQSPSDVAFHVTLADLDADRTSPADPQDNPLGLAAPHSLDDPLAVIDELLAVLESKQDLQGWLRAKGIRMACALPVVECLASLACTWPVLASGGRAATAVQKRLVCAAALSRLSVLTAEGKALAYYKVARISAGGVERLSAVATRQIEKLIAISEQLLTSMGSAMLETLIPDCLARTSLARQVDTENLIANLVSAGWLTPLAQAIVTSWKSVLATLESEPLAIAAGSTMQQISQCVFENTEHKAPQIFAQAMQRQLAAPTLLAALRTWIGNARSAEGLDLLFQIQCDQLRQYCEHITSAG